MLPAASSAHLSLEETKATRNFRHRSHPIATPRRFLHVHHPLSVPWRRSPTAAADHPAGGLRIAHPDGSQVRTALPGVTGAAFAPDGAWLAAVDGRGRIWRVDSQSGSASRLADGPFAGAVTFEPGGTVVAIAVAS